MRTPTAFATPTERGCGHRREGLYAECGTSKNGMPLEYFLIDPPQPLPAGLDHGELVNKPQILPTEKGGPFNLWIWVGKEHYPHVADFIEEARRYGVSRRLPPSLDLCLLDARSRMVLAHPRALNTLWATQHPCYDCRKNIEGHEGANPEAGITEHRGPCLYQTYQLIGAEDGRCPIPQVNGAPPVYLREIGSTLYSYMPTGETADGLAPGVFAVLPISGFALVKNGDGIVSETARRKLEEADLPYYETEV